MHDILPRNSPIATRLYASSAFWCVLILLIAGLGLSTIQRRTAVRAFDERLNVFLNAIVADVASPAEDTRTGPGELGEPQFELSLSGWYWQITRQDIPTHDVKASRSLFAARLPRLFDLGVEADIGGARQGYATGPDQRRLRIVERVIDAGDQGIYLVQVAATTEEMDAQIITFRLSLGITFLLLAMALVATTALQVRYGLAPLRRLQDGLALIRAGESDRVDEDLPSDIAPLAHELNLLIDFNKAIIERSRTHAGNLAHALKTPLSVLANEAGNEESPLASHVQEQTQIMRQQVTWHLERARAAARAGGIGAVTDVRPVLEGLVRAFVKICHDRSVEFILHMPKDLRFQGEKQDLEEMAGNLIDNAGKWASSKVMISAETHDEIVIGRNFLKLIIDDDGEGLAPARRKEALARGKRLDETRPGSGLGLSIVVDLAGLYSGSLDLEQSPLGGLRATLRLPIV